MGGIFGGGGGTKISTSAPVVSSLRMQTSAYGRAIPLLYGKARVASNVIWYNDFISIEHRSTQSAGGKGGGGGGTTVESISYTYQVALQLGLCEGPVRGVTNAWVGKKVGTIDHWNLSQFNGSYNQQPMGYVQSRHPDQALAYRGTAHVGTGVFELGDDPTLPNMTFEIDSGFGFSNDIRDANPRDVVIDFSTNPYYGAGVPASKFGDLKPFSDFCVANGLFISPAYTEQEPAHEILARLFRLTNSGVYFSEGKIKVVPYSDTAATGNGVTFTPNMAPVYDLTDDDFLASGSEDPILCTRVAASDAHNSVRVKFFNRGNSYNEEVAEAKDQASIEQFGLRMLEVELHEVADAGVARLVAQQILQRSLYVRNSYEFRLGWKYALLEPTDLVTLTDAALGLDKTPVRITEIEEDEDGELLVRAEEVPLGSVGATRYPTQNGDGYSSNYNMPAGPVSQPVIFEPPLSLAGAPQIWIATSGGKNWGGCDVWVSDDNATYLRIGRIVGRSRHGVLATKLDNGPGVDTVNNLRVDLSVSGGALLAATQQNAEELVTLCYVDGELLAYRDATLTAPNQYDLGYLVRGAHGTVISSHAAGSKFARLDQALAKFPYDKAKVGKTIYIKFQSFNIHGGGVEDLSTLTPVTYQITGAPLADVTGLSLEQPFTGRSCKIKWNPVDGAANYTVEVWAGTPQTLRRSASVGDARRFEYSWEDGKADGGPWRQLVFRVRATSQTGASGNWATLVASNPVPAVLTGVSVNPGFKSAFFSCNQPSDTDITGIRIWMSATSGFSPADDCLVYDGPDFFTTLYKLWSGAELAAGATYYVKAAAYDSFGKDGLNISSEVAVTPVSVAGGIKPGEIEAEMIKAIDASKVVGTLKDWQIDAINALKVTGQLSDAQVAGLSVEKLVGQVKLAQLAGDVQGPLNSAVSTANQALVKANESASATTVQKLQAAVGQRRRMLLRSCGFNDPQRDSGLWVDDAKVLAGGLGYTLATLNEAGNVVASARFDFQSDESALAAANWLNAVQTGTAVFVYADEDAWTRRLRSGFPDALYRAGASKAIFGNPAFKSRSAYLLVGRAGVGEGSGFEMYAGKIFNDPAARAELKFDWLNGPVGLGNNALGSLLQTNVDAALTRVGWVEAAMNDKAAASDLTSLRSEFAGNKATVDEQLTTLADADKALGQRIDNVTATANTDRSSTQAGINEVKTAVADAKQSSAQSINQVNARLAPGGDINNAINGKAAQASLDAAVQRISSAETTLAGKANAQDVTTLSARVGTAEASVTQVQQAQANLDGKVSSKWGVVLGAAQSDGRQKLAGIQAFNDGTVSQFVITADQLLINPGESLIPDPNYYQLDWWGRPGNPIEEASEAGWARSRRRLMMANGIATESISKQFVLEPGAAYRLEVEVYGNGGSGGIGVDLHVPGVWWWSFGGNGDSKWLTESQSGARTFATTVTIPRSIAFNWGQIRIRHAVTSGSYMVGLISVTRVSGSTLIADGAITTDKVAANAVTADKIAANQITATHIVVGSLTGDRLAANSITGDKVQAGAITANHIDSRGLTIKDTAGNIIFGAGQNLDVNRVAGLGSMARKSQVAASDMAIGQLSAITANIGEVTAGIMYSNDRQKYFNLDPARSAAMMYVPGAVQINFDGSGYFARTIVSAPDVRASGVAWVNSGWIGSSGTWTTFIDTGVNLPSGWSTASSDMFQASATIAGGNSQSGGAMGYTSAEVVHGDGLLAGAANSPIDNRMYIKFTWNGAGTSGGVINITRIDWKLVRV
ncbi:phage tail protein [Chromobacterium sp. LK1]|uniref:phage tail protein n=1 Tax=Chromobacterium sp. LK1 TaxID=1628193 RepID=UPI00069FCEB5|nr:phage tail protein [Chromobacterium sp. LK1]